MGEYLFFSKKVLIVEIEQWLSIFWGAATNRSISEQHSLSAAHRADSVVLHPQNSPK